MPIPRMKKARPFTNKKIFIIRVEFVVLVFKAHIHDLKKAHKNRRSLIMMSKGENKFKCRISLF